MRDEGHHQHRHAARGVEEFVEFDEAPALQPAQHDAHVLAHRQLLARDGVVLGEPGALQDLAPGLAQVVGVHLGPARLQALFDVHLGAQEVAADAAAARRACAAASLICSYSTSRRTSSARGSSGSPPSALFFGGSSMRDLISISIAAISRYSLASSRLWWRIWST